jgi:hypothetical protein
VASATSTAGDRSGKCLESERTRTGSSHRLRCLLTAGQRQECLGVIEPDRSCGSRSNNYHRYNCPQARLLRLMTGARVVALRWQVKNLFAPAAGPRLPSHGQVGGAQGPLTFSRRQG